MLLKTFLLAFIANVSFSLELQQEHSYQPVSVAYCNANATTDVNDYTTNWNNLNFSSSDIVSDIQSLRFDEADKKISQIGVSSPEIATIIKAAYGNSLTNFDSINAYGKASSEPSIHCSVLVELWNLMNLHGDMDVYKLMELYRSLSDEHVIGNTTTQQRNTTQQMKFIVTKVRDVGVRNAIFKIAKETIKKTLLDGYYRENISIQKMVNELNIMFNAHFFDDVISKVIDEVYSEMPTDDLIKAMYNEEQKRQSAEALLYISKKLSTERKQRSNDRANLVMAGSLKRLKQLSDVSMDNAFLDEAISKLPHSLKNLYFADRVSLFNVGYEEYLYLPKVEAYVVSEDIPNPTIRDTWIAVQYGAEEGSFKFISEYIRNEYMYSSDINAFSKKPYRYVKTWTLGMFSLDRQSAWQIYPIDDYVFIKSLHNNGYLCLSDDLLDNLNRYVFTKKNGKKPELLECQWKVSDRSIRKRSNS